MVARYLHILSENLHKLGIEITQLNPINDNEWDQLVTAHHDHTIFHRTAWAKVLTETYSHRPCYLKVAISGKEVALVPLMAVKSSLTGHRGCALPFSDFASPLWSETEHTALVYQAILEVAANQKWKHLELRELKVPPVTSKPFKTYQNLKLDLTRDLAEIHRNLKPAVRQALRKANRSGIKVTVERSESSLSKFYHLHTQTRKRHGLPPQPIKFFDSIATNLIRNEMGFLVLAHQASTAIAGAMFLHSNQRGIFKFGASEPKHWPQRPNHAVMWQGICELRRLKCDELDFGRTYTTDEGLLNFKRSWGAIAANIEYYRHSLITNKWVTAKQGSESLHPLIFGNLPNACNRLLGRLIYPHLD